MREIRNGFAEFFFAFWLGQNVFLRAGQDAELGYGTRGGPVGPLKALKECAAFLVLAQHNFDRFMLGPGERALAAAFGIGGDRLLQFLGEAEVIDNEAAGFFAEDPVDARDGLHEAVLVHVLIEVHGVEAGHVEAGEPHVADDDEAERVVRILEAFGNGFETQLFADMGLPFQGVGHAASHDDLMAPVSSSPECQAGRSLTISL